MTDPRTAPFDAVRLTDVAQDTTSSGNPGGGAFHLVRRHFDVQAFGVNGATADAGEIVISEHDERDDTDYGTEGHEELFAVLNGHAIFTIDGTDLDAPAGTLVFVRDPALKRSAARHRGGHPGPRRRRASGCPVHRVALGAGDRLKPTVGYQAGGD